jgi:1-acyl-sn-glycerol-3-phosphate acyltransferase
MFDLKVYGIKNLPRKGGFILAANHVSNLDPILMGSTCPRRVSFMAKRELFCNSLVSWFLFQLGAFPVKRGVADIYALKESIHRLKNGQGLVLFPEGGRQFNGLSDKPEAGIGFIAVKTGVPIVPAFIKGSDKVLPIGAKFFHFNKISVYFGKPRALSFEERDKQISVERRMPYQDVARLVMDDIRRIACSVSN